MNVKSVVWMVFFIDKYSHHELSTKSVVNKQPLESITHSTILYFELLNAFLIFMHPFGVGI